MCNTGIIEGVGVKSGLTIGLIGSVAVDMIQHCRQIVNI